MTGLQARPPSPFATHVAGDRQRALVRLVGELDLASAPSAEQAIVQAERFRTSLLELDLSSLVFMDSTGLRLLLNTRQRSKSAGACCCTAGRTPSNASSR
jgi:anti-anti-sigma factor